MQNDMKDRYAQLDMATRRARAARRSFECQPPVPGAPAHVPVAIVGAGPVGLAAAADLAQHGICSVVLDKVSTLSDGSRAICWAKRSLEICDRLGIASRMLDKGITWNIGRVFFGADPAPLYSFDLLLTDIVMPVMDGIELARKAAEVAPGMKIMFITGFAAVALNPKSNAPKDAKVLSKPFHLRDLVTEVERFMAAA